ncbi:CYFA0S12e00166g1_1 [Cyberlindnera fabianii]|uniref:Protein BTN n=1 Tax=Cyberlindnera fabianii TaxID=36022 RepID=A0A061B932_CYBFA|nr:CYFA0S12e00166g1_1 [Cyberlindnera fabianii]
MSLRISSVFASFWLFGLLNNVLYVVILSAAVDLVGPLVPKATVLLADILPSFTIKVTAPFFIHRIAYPHRICGLIALSLTGMGFIVFGSLRLKLFGIILASLSSGLGEITFLQLTHFYKEVSLNGWSSGTGGAGLVGSGLFLLMTTILKVNVKTTLLMFAIFPLGFLHYFRLPPPETEVYQELPVEESQQTFTAKDSFKTTVKRLKGLVVPFMIPLSTVYFAEYLINQSVSPTLLFPIEDTPFAKYRDIYVTYGTLYQLGVFISRSSASVVRVKNLYIPSVLQFVNLFLLILQSLYYFIPSVYIIMIIVFYEGLLGGAAYVNTFMLIIETIAESEREFSLGATSMSDSGGIVFSALVGLWLEPNLCKYQVGHGRDWCQKS